MPTLLPLPSTPKIYMHRDTPTHTAYTWSHLANKHKKKKEKKEKRGLSAMKRTFGSKTSSLFRGLDGAWLSGTEIRFTFERY